MAAFLLASDSASSLISLALKAIFVDMTKIGEVLGRIGRHRPRIFGLAQAVEEGPLETCLRDARMGGLQRWAAT